MVGMAAAVALAQGGIATLLVDSEPAEERVSAGYDGRSSAIAFGSQQALDQLGIWRAMANEAEAILDIRVSDGRPGEPAAPLFLHYDHRESGLEAPFGHIVENRVTRRALLARLAELPLATVFAPARLAKVERGADFVEAELADGRSIRAGLLLAADGANSPLRAAAGIPIAQFVYEQTGIVATVAHELAHEGVAHECFLPSGPFAMLPMT
ncbi:MAG: FAD-dependent monooxygenase, partial [Gemmatimonadales bacterium]